MEDPTIDSLFDKRISFPDIDASKRFTNLVGIDDVKKRLVRSLSILVNKEGVKKWAKKYHSEKINILNFVYRRPPLVILAGDVGTGKTELANTIADPVARAESIEITLFPLSLSTRGSGRVGEITKLLSTAFEETYNTAKKLKSHEGKARGAVILLVDEADSIVQSRENAQMHHEDRAGVNAFIRGVDKLSEHELPVAVVLCTNRLTAIDPAVKRRAADIFEFDRPNPKQRKIVLEEPLKQLNFSSKEIDDIVELTGPVKGKKYGFTFSDLTQRLLPVLVIDAYPDHPITYKRAVEITNGIRPTPPFQEDNT